MRRPWRAAAYAVGTHDFCRLYERRQQNNRHRAHRALFSAMQREGRAIVLHICADGYLYNMVRILAGTLVEAGAGRMPPEGAARGAAKQAARAGGRHCPGEGPVFCTA